ncbi:MAG: DNA repair protein RecO [Acidimicrobiales bacterium]
MPLYRDHGIVLRTHKLGEADRIVVFVTAQHGKVRAVAKGARKSGSRFSARLEPPSHVALQLYEGRELDTVTQAETVDHFRAIKDDLDRLSKASSLLEAIDQVAQEAEPDASLYQLLLGALRALAASDAALLSPAFFLKLLAHDGVRPVVDRCVACGRPDDLCAFDLLEGGLLCREHRRGLSVSVDAVVLLQLVLGGGLARALELSRSAATDEVDHLATHALEQHLERRLKSIGVLDRH